MRKPDHTQQNAPEAVGIFLVVGAMHIVLVEGNASTNLVRHLVDLTLRFRAERAGAGLAVEIGNRHRPQHQLPRVPSAVQDPENVIDEIELDLKILPAELMSGVTSPRASRGASRARNG